MTPEHNKDVDIFAHYFLVAITDKILPSQAWTVLTIKIHGCPVTVSDDDFSFL